MSFDRERTPVRSALCGDRVDATLPGPQAGSRPQPPQAVARSASLDAGTAVDHP